jgi:glutaryl-CoA dehydrogenase
MNSVQSSLVMYPIYAYGSNSARVSASTRFRRVGGPGLTRPDAGSIPAP